MNSQYSESMNIDNLDDFIFPENIMTPAAISPSPEFEKKQMPNSSSTSVAAAIPIKPRKESGHIVIPNSVPVHQHNTRNDDEFNYVQRHFRKTSIDERRVRTRAIRIV